MHRPAQPRTALGFALLASALILISGFAAPASAANYPLAGVVPDVPPGQSPPHVGFAADPSMDLAWGGGPVQHTNRTHIILWLPSNRSLTFPPSYTALIQQFLTDVASDNGKTTNPYAADGQYRDASGRAAYSSTFADVHTATDPLPAVNGCTLPPASAPPTWTTANEICLSDAQLRAELDSYITAQQLPRGINEIYFLVTPDTFGSCFTTGPNNCSLSGGGVATGAYCAYHSALSDGTPYANQPFDDAGGHCNSSVMPRPNSNSADITLSSLSHEHNETVTDPNAGSGWINASHNEIGDLCASFNQFGAPIDNSGPVTAGGNVWNTDINTHRYFIQGEWSNENSDCVQTEDSPTATIGPATLTGATGTPATLSGSGTDPDPCPDSAFTPCGAIAGYSWDFGNGTHSSAQNPQVTYATAGTFTVSLTVTDTSNNTATTSKQITIDTSPACVAQAGVTTPHNRAKAIVLACSDHDASETIAYSLVSPPARGTASAPDAAGNVAYTPTTGYAGPDSFTFKATDSTGTSSAPAQVSLVVGPNNAPTCSNQVVAVRHGAAALLSLLCSDLDPVQSLTRAIVTPPAHGALGTPNAAGIVTYRPAATFAGSDAFTYRATDSEGASSPIGTITLSVSCSGLTSEALGQCTATRAHVSALKSCAAIRSRKRRAACRRTADRTYRRALALAHCQTLKGAKRRTCIARARRLS